LALSVKNSFHVLNENEIMMLKDTNRVDTAKKSALLDTLAQLPTTLYKKARAKYYTNKIVAPLLYIDSPLHKQYQRAYYCNHNIIQEGNTFKAKYCNSRACHICNRIRTAKCMNGYTAQLQGLGQMSFTTLTIRNVNKEQLRDTVKQMTKALTNIVRVIRERKKIDISGIRKIEITYNDIADNYHPHIHILHNKDCGHLIINEWLKRYSNDADIKAQDTKKANRDSLNELFKYSTKVAYKAKGDKEHKVFIHALDTILIALNGLRTFQPFGVIKKQSEEVEELQVQELEGVEQAYTEWEYNEDKSDWENIYNRGQFLTGYKPPELKLIIYY
jgi:hypothetical protein